MRKLSLFLCFSLSAVVAFANGPLFQHKDTYVNQEFDNVYQDVRGSKPSSKISGTTTNDSASAGYIGEAARSLGGSGNAATSGQYKDVTSISLTAGDWDISGLVNFDGNTSTQITTYLMGISATSGNDGTGLTVADNKCEYDPGANSNSSIVLSVPSYRVSLSATTIYFLKALVVYTNGQPLVSGRISARRMR